MEEKDIRWKQRFQNYQKALARLEDAVGLFNERPLTSIEKQGFIKAFEFTHELAWNVMKDYFIYQGSTRIIGSRDAIREAFRNKMVTDGDNWMEMIHTRHKAVHTYDDVMVDDIVLKTVDVYYPLFKNYEQVMKQLSDE